MSVILLVDDDPDQNEIRRLLLERVGHTVAIAVDAVTARREFLRCSPQVVVMDLHLPEEEDALMLIREFRGQGPALRILVMSGWTAGFAESPEASLVNAVLQKPVRAQEFLDLAGQ